MKGDILTEPVGLLGTRHGIAFARMTRDAIEGRLAGADSALHGNLA